MLKNDPRGSNNVKRLHGRLSGRLRYRVGDYRVIYRIDEEAQIVHILAIVHRREAYE
jgi:mRNA interferase RelE/StbE